MTDILVTLPDGTTELRAANSPAFFDEGPRSENRWPKVTPGNVVDGEAFPPDWTGLGYLFKSADGEAYAQRLSTFQVMGVGRTFTPIVWTERWGWRPCTVETVDEQIARLTRERDTEKERADAAEWRWTEAACFIRQNAKAAAWDSDEPTSAACERILTEMARLNMDRRPA